MLKNLIHLTKLGLSIKDIVKMKWKKMKHILASKLDRTVEIYTGYIAQIKALLDIVIFIMQCTYSCSIVM